MGQDKFIKKFRLFIEKSHHTKKKSLGYPEGVLGFFKSRSRVEILDPEIFEILHLGFFRDFALGIFSGFSDPDRGWLAWLPNILQSRLRLRF